MRLLQKLCKLNFKFSLQTFKGTKRRTVTNEQGIVDFKPFPFGVVDIKCEMEGFEPFLLKDFKVVRGKLNEVEVTLKRAA